MIEAVIRWAREHGDRLVGLVAALAIPAVAGFAVHFIESDAAKSANDALRDVSVASIVVIGSLLLYIFCESVLSRLRTRSAPIRLADRLQELEYKHTAFDSEVLSIINVTRGGNRRISEPQRSAFNKAHELLLVELCNKAVQIISAQKGISGKVLSANIKTLSLDQTCGRHTYSVVARSDRSDPGRDLADNRCLYVDENVYYKTIMNNDVYERPRYKFGDFRQVLASIKKINDRRKSDEIYLQEPQRGAERFYKSAIIVPIFGPPNPDSSSAFVADKNAMTFRNQGLIGFMCVDSKRKYTFDDEFDICIVNQLAIQAFNVIRFYKNISALIDNSGE